VLPGCTSSKISVLRRPRLRLIPVPPPHFYVPLAPVILDDDGALRRTPLQVRLCLFASSARACRGTRSGCRPSFPLQFSLCLPFFRAFPPPSSRRRLSSGVAATSPLLAYFSLGWSFRRFPSSFLKLDGIGVVLLHAAI